MGGSITYIPNVALRKESVDRNALSLRTYRQKFGSLSARRAWIEIGNAETAKTSIGSLSARRAWIEIIDDLEPSSTRRVALRKESVDRNHAADIS